MDPGLRHTGWGVVEFKHNKIFHIEDGSISPSTKLDDGQRLLEIKNQLQKIIKQYNPNMSVVEKIFVGSGSISSLKLGMARGASMIALSEAGLSMWAGFYQMVVDSAGGSSEITYTLHAGPWGSNNGSEFNVNKAVGDSELGGAQLIIYEVSG